MRLRDDVDNALVLKDFNPLTPCGVRLPPEEVLQRRRSWKFQSTHSVWSETRTLNRKEGPPGNYFNPLTPCGVRRVFQSLLGFLHRRFQSTHSVWSETQQAQDEYNKQQSNFNPLTPCGVRHINSPNPAGRKKNFNPLTPCGVRHPHINTPRPSGVNFNPLTPCGVRPNPHPDPDGGGKFQSTHSVWSETLLG